MHTNAHPQIARAIDVGCGHVKFSTGESGISKGVFDIACGSFPALPIRSTRHYKEDASGVELGAKLKVTSIDVDGQTFVISADPEVIAVPSDSRSAGENYVSSRSFRICIAAAIKQMQLPYPRIDHLVLGAPVGNFEAAKKALLENFAVGVQFDDQKVGIGQIHVVQQPIGGLLYQYRTNGHEADLAGYTRLVIDVGYGTLSWVVAHGLVPVHDRSGTVSYGVERLIDTIHHEVSKAYGSFSENLAITEDIDRMLKGTYNDFFFRGQSYDHERFERLINGIIDQGLEAVFKNVGKTTDLRCVVVVGGQGRRYGKRLQAMKPALHVEIVGSTGTDACLANVRGFQLIAERQRGVSSAEC